MRIALLHNHYDQEHLNKVVEEMKTMGAPKIKVLDLGFDDMAQALEGSHRLRAAEILGITPEFEWIGEDELVADLDLDVDCDEGATVSELGDYENYQIEMDA